MSQPTRSRSTLQDVARRAGVSASTASSVLAGNSERRRIGEETKQKVFEAAQALAYTPNLLHRSIRNGRTRIISVFNAYRRRDRDDLYLDRLYSSIEEAGGQLGYNILVHTDYRQSIEETYEFLNGGFSDGLVLFGVTENDPLLPLLKDSGLPTVLLFPRQEIPDLPMVLEDQAMGMRLVAEELYRTGHRNIAALTYDSDGLFDPTSRVAQLQKELRHLGGDLEDRNVLLFDNDPVETVRQLLALEPRPTALFIWHDGNGYRILEALEEAEVQIPQQLSVVGYDGIVWPSKSSKILASVNVPVYEIARSGVELLDRMIAGDYSVRQLVVPVDFAPGTTLARTSTHENIQ